MMQLLKKLGMGALLLLLTANGQEEKTKSWDVTCEIFSVSLSEAAKLKRAGKSDQEDYADLVKRVEKNKAGLEEFLMARVLKGQTNSVEEISEMIYATEYDPPEMPAVIGDLAENLEAAKNLVSPANPTAFETKNVGTMMEVILENPGDGAVDLSLVLTLVDFLGLQVWGQGVAQAEMPRFAVQALKSQLKVKLDSATLLGSISPPAALQPKEGGREVWLAFVTVSKSKE